MSAAGEILGQAFIDAIAEAVADKLLQRLDGKQSPVKRLYTIEEAATYLGRTRDAVYQLVHRRKIETVREGRRVHITRESLDDFLERGKVA